MPATPKIKQGVVDHMYCFAGPPLVIPALVGSAVGLYTSITIAFMARSIHGVRPHV
jgi:hypothetical protein